MTSRQRNEVRNEFRQFRIATVIGSVWLVIPMLRGKTLLPWWAGVLPFVFIPAVLIYVLSFVLSPVPSWLVHALGGPFLLGVLYAQDSNASAEGKALRPSRVRRQSHRRRLFTPLADAPALRSMANE
jgi:hypothetical protein